MNRSGVAITLKSALALLIALIRRVPVLSLVLAMLMVLDIFSAWIAEGQEGKVSSNKMGPGLRKKMMTLLLVGLGFVIDYAVINSGGQLPFSFGTAASGFFCLEEGLSILENAAVAGVKVPAFLKDGLELLAPEREIEGS